MQADEVTGWFGKLPSLGDFASVLSRCDAVLLLGKRLDFTLKHGKPPLGPTVRYAQVDADAPEFDRTRRAVGPRLDRQAQADFASACEALARACTQPPKRCSARWHGRSCSANCAKTLRRQRSLIAPTC